MVAEEFNLPLSPLILSIIAVPFIAGCDLAAAQLSRVCDRAAELRPLVPRHAHPGAPARLLAAGRVAAVELGAGQRRQR